MIKITRYLIGSVFLLALLQGCDYNDYDNPPEVSNVIATHTIKQLKSMYRDGGKEVVSNEEIIVSGRVISSDKEGNIYKSLVIQDETAGIEIKINSNGLYNYFKLGSIVYLHANYLKLGAYGGTVSIGSVPVDNNYENDFIPAPVMKNYVIKGAQDAPVKPVKLTIPTLRERYSNMLVEIDDVQFIESEVSNNLSYTDNYVNDKKEAEKVTGNRTLVDGDDNRLVVRTSGYARFADKKIPAGSGSVKGILTYFNGTPQLTIVSIDDVQLNKPRFIDIILK